MNCRGCLCEKVAAFAEAWVRAALGLDGSLIVKQLLIGSSSASDGLWSYDFEEQVC